MTLAQQEKWRSIFPWCKGHDTYIKLQEMGLNLLRHFVLQFRLLLRANTSLQGECTLFSRRKHTLWFSGVAFLC